MSDHPYRRERVYERCQAFYVYARAKLLTHLDEIDVTERHSRTTLSEQDTSASTALLPRSALPRIKLPSFSGDYKSWRSFHDLFSSLIKNNPDWISVEKMHYLKTCVTEEASRLVGNLSISGQLSNCIESIGFGIREQAIFNQRTIGQDYGLETAQDKKRARSSSSIDYNL